MASHGTDQGDVSAAPWPEVIKLHRNSGVLELVFSDGQRFELSAEFLRVYSPSAEVRGHGAGPPALRGDEHRVAIKDLEPVGHYAIKLIFDDGHNTGLYSWTYLYEISTHKDKLWRDYLQRLESAGYQRGPAAERPAPEQ